MAEKLNITSIGQGQALVFIHGWGLNSGVWQPLAEKLSEHFKVITVDLPGFGLNVDISVTPYSLKNVAEKIIESVAEPAIYIGWSLGGLVATEIALSYQEKVLGLVTITSSPCFVEQKVEQKAEQKSADEITWPGIRPIVLKSFHQQLSKDIEKTIDGFLKIQAMGSPHIRQDIKQIRQLVMQYPVPSKAVLSDGLMLLAQSDLRQRMASLTMPFLRIYGQLDSLVPNSVVPMVTELTDNSEQHVFMQASHAPFISHLDDFYKKLYSWLSSKSFSSFEK